VAYRQTNVRSSHLTLSIFRLALLALLLLWGIGLFDLATHVSGNPDTAVLGLYARPVFAVLVVYASFFFVWLAAFLLPQSRTWLAAALIYVQARWWLALPLLALLALLGWSLFAWPEWLDYPTLSMVTLIGLVLSGALLILYDWRLAAGDQVWRKIIAVLVAVVLLGELGAQGLAFTGHLPGTHQLDGRYAPHGRVYQNVEGLGNGRANGYGLYYPEFQLADDTRRILVIGDTFVQALQIERTDHLGVRLETLIHDASLASRGAAAADQPPTEVLALGYPGFGPGLYLDIQMLAYAIDAFDPDEIIALIHLGNDLVNLTTPSHERLYFAVDESSPDRNVHVTVHPENFRYWHNIAHYVLTGLEPYSPIRTIDSHILTPKLLADAARGGRNTAIAADSSDPLAIPGVQGRVTRFGAKRGDHTIVESIVLEATPGRSNFLFAKAGNADAQAAMAITTALLDTFHDFTRAQGIDFRIATIPVFPPAFYSEFDGTDWQPDIGEYDLFLPEAKLAAFATEEGIPFLATGQHMAHANLSVAQIRSFYYAKGLGHFTPAGHTYMAQIMYDCFYAPAAQRGAQQALFCPAQ